MQASDALSLARSQRSNQREQTKKAMEFANRKIATAATLGELDIVIDVPNHFDGAVYDKGAAFAEVVQNLASNGYHVRVLSSSILYISWRYAKR